MRDHITVNACAHLQVGQFWWVIFSFSRCFSQIHIIRWPWWCFILHLLKWLHGLRSMDLWFHWKAVTKHRTSKVQKSWYSMVMNSSFQIWLNRLMQKKKIPMCYLLLHTTHVSQTFDMVIFDPIKAHFNHPKPYDTCWKQNQIYDIFQTIMGVNDSGTYKNRFLKVRHKWRLIRIRLEE